MYSIVYSEKKEREKEQLGDEKREEESKSSFMGSKMTWKREGIQGVVLASHDHVPDLGGW